MADDIAISVRGMSKAYRIWETPAGRLIAPFLEEAARLLPQKSELAGSLRRRAAKHYRDFWALKNVSFDVRKGQAVAIIGRNGSGKSTLLQIITGTLQPTIGQIKVNGRIAALLELGSGFNPEFTGRENVFLNGAILGLSNAVLTARFEEIAAFAEIGEFIDQPVKTYSSGMTMRLAFALAAHVDADILIIDEALSVGDARFQLKCARTIDRFIEEGRTLLFVSHDVSMVKRLCRQALLLNQGEQLYLGHPNEVVNLYSQLIADGGSTEAVAEAIAALGKNDGAKPEPEDKAPAPSSRADRVPSLPNQTQAELAALRMKLKAMEIALATHPASAEVMKKVEALIADEKRHLQVSGQEFSYGGELGKIQEIEILDNDGQARTWFQTGEPVTVRMVVEACGDYPDPIFALTIKNNAGVEIYGTNTFASNQPTLPMAANEQREVIFRFDLNLMPGHYFLSFGFTHWVGSELLVLHRRYDAIKIDIHGRDRTFGIANLNAVIETRTPAVERRLLS